MNHDLKEKLEEAIELAVFDAYGDCNTIDGVSVAGALGYYYGGYIATNVSDYPRGVSELKADTDLKEMGIKITHIEWSRDEEYIDGERDIRIWFTLNEQGNYIRQ